MAAYPKVPHMIGNIFFFTGKESTKTFDRISLYNYKEIT